MSLRRIKRIEYGSGQFYDIPGYQFAQETDQGLHTAFADLTGQDYAYDMLGVSAAPKMNAIERVGFLLVGTEEEIESDRDLLETSLTGRLTLWDSDDRIARARLAGQPRISMTVENRNHLPVVLIFERYTDWEETS